MTTETPQPQERSACNRFGRKHGGTGVMTLLMFVGVALPACLGIIAAAIDPEWALKYGQWLNGVLLLGIFGPPLAYLRFRYALVAIAVIVAFLVLFGIFAQMWDSWNSPFS